MKITFKFVLNFFYLITLFYSNPYIFSASIEPSETHLFLIRNGATPRNVLGMVQGQEEVPDSQLNEEGKEQAKQAGKLLKTLHPEMSSKFYSSPLGRALDTAKLAAQNFNEVIIIQKDGLKEISHGYHDGMNKDLRNNYYKQFYERELSKLQAQFPGQDIDPFFKWKTNPLAGAETYLSLCQRSTKALVDIGEENLGQEIAVFTHGALIEVLIANFHYTHSLEHDQILPLWYEKPCMPNCSIAHFIYNSQAEREEDKLQFIGFEK